MTNEEAINVLNDYDINFERNTAEEIAEAHEIAIKAIRTMPSEDCISRQAVDDAIYDYSRSCDVNYQQIMEFIDKIPPANPQEPKTEERTEMHECDCISRELMHDMGATCIAARNKDGDLVALGALDLLPSVYATKPKTDGDKMNELTKVKQRILERIETYIGDIEFAEEKELTEDEKTIFKSVKNIILEEFDRVTPSNTEYIIKTTIKEYLDKECDDVIELLLTLSKDLCERIRKENKNEL